MSDHHDMRRLLTIIESAELDEFDRAFNKINEQVVGFVIGKDGKRIPQFHNPTRAELASAFRSSEHLRGILTQSDDLYVMDAYYGDHNKVATDLGIEFAPETFRVILAKNYINVQFCSYLYWNRNDVEDVDTNTVFSLVQQSKRLNYLFPATTKVNIVLYDNDYLEYASDDFILGQR